MKKIVSIFLAVITAVLSLSVTASADAVTDEFAAYLSRHFQSYSESEIDITPFVDKYGWSKDKTLEMLSSAYYSHPEFFYVKNAFLYTVWNNKITSVKFDYVIPQSRYQYALGQFDEAAEKAVAGITPDMSDVDKAVYIHDYIILNCRYDSQKKKYSGYNCLVDGSCVCQGYSLAYEYILTKYLGMECTTVYSEKKNHIWNYVKIGNNWYHMDLTLDDIVDSYGGNSSDRYGCVLHENVLMSDRACRNSSDLHADWIVAGGYPAASDTSYDNAFWNDIRSHLCYADGCYYYTKNGGKENNRRVVQVCRYDPATGESTVIMKLKCLWYSRRSSQSTADSVYGTQAYTGIYASLEYANGRLFVNTNKSVYSYDLAAKKAKKLYTLSKGDEMQIFGMAMTDGKLRIAYRKDLTYSENYLKLVLK